MRAYIITLAAYILVFPLLLLFLPLEFSLLGMLATSAFALYHFRKEFKFYLKFDLLAIVTGIAIAIIWIGIDGLYPHLGTPDVYDYNNMSIIIKLIISIILAPIIEEFFTRSFLIRYVISKSWKNVKLGKYTFASFIVTVLFFGFSHNRWLAGIITGIALNLLLYRRKKIEPCILAHAVANATLACYVIYTGNFAFW